MLEINASSRRIMCIDAVGHRLISCASGWHKIWLNFLCSGTGIIFSFKHCKAHYSGVFEIIYISKICTKMVWLISVWNSIFDLQQFNIDKICTYVVKSHTHGDARRKMLRSCFDVLFIMFMSYRKISQSLLGPLLLTWCNFNPSMDK